MDRHSRPIELEREDNQEQTTMGIPQGEGYGEGVGSRFGGRGE